MNADWQEAQTFQRKLHLSLTRSSHPEFTSEFATNSQELQDFFVCVCAAIKRWENEGSWGWTLSSLSLQPDQRKHTPVLTGVTVNEWSLTYLRLPGTLPIFLSLVHSVPFSLWQEFHIFSSYLKLPTTPLILNGWHCLLFPVRIRNNQKRPSTCSCPTISRKLCLWAISAPVSMRELSMVLAEVNTYIVLWVPSPGTFLRILLPPVFHLFPT